MGFKTYILGIKSLINEHKSYIYYRIRNKKCVKGDLICELQFYQQIHGFFSLFKTHDT